MSLFAEEVNKIKKSPSYGPADFGHRPRDDKCASCNNSICSHNSLTFRDSPNEHFPAIKPPSQRRVTVIKC